MKAQIQERIDALKAELKGLEQDLNKPDVPTYDDVLARVQPEWVKSVDGLDVGASNCSRMYAYPDRQTAEREALRAMWLNIAVYVNEGKEGGWRVGVSRENGEVFFGSFECIYAGIVTFKDEPAARLAVQIMGEDNFRKMCGV
jgi:hypothetical protein